MNTQMQAIHVTTVHQGYDARIFVKECMGLAQQGYRVALMTTDAEVDESGKVRIDKITIPKNRLLRFICGSYIVVKNCSKSSATIVHLHDPELLIAGWMLQRRGKQVIYDVHEDVPKQILTKQWIPKFLRNFVATTFAALEKFIARRLEAIVCATEVIAARFSQYHKQVIVLHNWPRLAEFIAANAAGKRKNSENIVFGYLGGIARERGAEVMMSAVEQLNARNTPKPCCLYLAGPIDSAYLEQLQKLPAWKYVNYFGVLSRDKLADFMAQIDFGLFLPLPLQRYMDGWPTKLFEYMAAKRTFVTSDFPRFKHFFCEQHYGMCADPVNSVAVVEAMYFLLSNPVKAQEMAQRGYHAVEQRYNWDHEQIKLTELYQRLLQSS